MRATYRRLKGTEQILGFYDVHADCLSGVFRKRKRLPDLFEAFRRLRSCYPRTRLFVVLDNLHNTHDHPRFLALLKRLRIHPVWTPTESSWLKETDSEDIVGGIEVRLGHLLAESGWGKVLPVSSSVVSLTGAGGKPVSCQSSAALNRTTSHLSACWRRTGSFACSSLSM
jgi:hypothetical protein